jgi:hypothetical protein
MKRRLLPPHGAGILFGVGKTLITIAADPNHLGARIGLTAVLHTWGSTDATYSRGLAQS